ncbi:LacI family DNA-binding transcriptional regulator [Pseudomonas fulva]|jgi:LacI family transcriptional regulator, gluconate utilization system Gnt-I transcriptional repressor|uniref:LacI family DNA-binding transcriptional regulator n=1 Tax=Pseudomonas TaxID=286 RepID=UPI0019D168B2|nr:MULTISPECIES: LacI family DNA-binding transcriptional regulator [Pseudomonas]MBN6790419.1 LacI family DNA-binding transcriptional regulator [Pseudomonas fulva]MBN6795275.1 LacI family DNA-binding transcriptional regulator [Pseudomonas fulva]MBN6855935.1 LacI family DNA-binding transcriptional regulator [Pseudomonas fulva]MBN6873459.1 LacI family DNA-binding transcriptional regulator [Pseudomonas fulva]MBN6877402.1 LacI family DNA-binding transcriptional regulator [Pseudomonas fulva]
MARIGSRTTGRPTLAEVARLSGVSPITASRALRGVSTVAPELAAKVVAAATTLGYVANPAARALASARSHSVVVLIPSLSNQLFIDTLEAIHDVMRPRGLEVLIGNYHYDTAEEENLIRNYLAYQPCGMLLTGFERTDASRQMLAASGVPCVHMMELDGEADALAVGFSQHQAGRAAAQHLIERGCTRPGFIAAQLDPRVMQRAEGFRLALAEAGLHAPEREVLTPAPSSIALGGELFSRLIRQAPEVDGIFFCNDDLAQGAVLQALRQGIRVPQEVAMVGFNDLPASAHMVPRLTSIRTPRAAVGRVAAQALLTLLDGKAVTPARQDLGFELMVRESS